MYINFLTILEKIKIQKIQKIKIQFQKQICFIKYEQYLRSTKLYIFITKLLQKYEILHFIIFVLFVHYILIKLRYKSCEGIVESMDFLIDINL